MRKVSVSVIMPVRLSAHVGQLGSHLTDFYEIWYVSFFLTFIDIV